MTLAVILRIEVETHVTPQIKNAHPESRINIKPSDQAFTTDGF